MVDVLPCELTRSIPILPPHYTRVWKEALRNQEASLNAAYHYVDFTREKKHKITRYAVWCNRFPPFQFCESRQSDNT